MMYFIYLPDLDLGSSFFYAEDDKAALAICLKLTAFFNDDLLFELFRYVCGRSEKVEVKYE